METQSLYRFVQEFLFHSASHFLNKVQCNSFGTKNLSEVGLGSGTCDKGTQCIVQTVDIEIETDQVLSDHISSSRYQVTKMCREEGRGGGGGDRDEVINLHTHTHTRDGGSSQKVERPN